MRIFKLGKDIKYKDFYLAIGGRPCWMKWLIRWVGQGFIFHAIIPHDKQKSCSPHQSQSQHPLASPAKTVNSPRSSLIKQKCCSPFALKFTRSCMLEEGGGNECLPCSYTLYCLVKILLVKLKNVDSSACSGLKCGTTKQ